MHASASRASALSLPCRHRFGLRCHQPRSILASRPGMRCPAQLQATTRHSWLLFPLCTHASLKEHQQSKEISICPQTELQSSKLGETQRMSGPTTSALLCAAAASIGVLTTAAAASANEGTLSGPAVEIFEQFLLQVEALGPLGGVLFVTVVMLFEMVPLFPTQPLSLASGLLFGAQKGALLMLLGVTLAACNAFFLSRGVGRPLAQKVIDAEMSHDDGDGKEAGAIAKTMADVQAAIESGGLWKQLTAILLLRLTPVVPFSASNYLLGLTPVQFPAYLGGTIVGMSVWSTLYASLGGASRSLLDKGADIETLLSDLSDKAGSLSTNVVYATGGLVVAAAAAFLFRTYVQWPSNEDGALSSTDDAPTPGSTKQRTTSKASAAQRESVSAMSRRSRGRGQSTER